MCTTDAQHQTLCEGAVESIVCSRGGGGDRHRDAYQLDTSRCRHIHDYMLRVQQVVLLSGTGFAPARRVQRALRLCAKDVYGMFTLGSSAPH